MQAKTNKNNIRSNIGLGFAGTDAKKVKQEIQRDLEVGQGAMTSREAGAMRDKK